MRVNRWTIFGLCTSLFVMSMLFRASSAVIAPDLSRDLGLDYHDLGLLGGVFFYAFALVQLPMGPILDRLGGRLTMSMLNLVGGLGAIVFAQAEGLTGGLIGRALLGIGMSANLMGGLWIFSRWFEPNRFATMIGSTMAVGTLGAMLAATPLALLVQWLTWRGAFLLLGGITLFLAAGLWLWVRDEPPADKAAGRAVEADAIPMPVLSSVKHLFASRDYWAISLTAFMRYGAYASIQALWAGPFLIVHLGLDPVAAGNVLLALNTGFIVGAPVGGVLSDRWLGSRKRAVQLGLAVIMLAVLALAVWPQSGARPVLAAVFFALGFFASFANIIYAQIKENMPREMAGTAMTGVNFFTMMGAGVFVHGLGGVLSRWADPATGQASYSTAFLVCFGALALAMIVYSTTRDSRPSR